MNDAARSFIESLQNNPDVLAIILFGSRARGNARPDSDFDLEVICKEGFNKTIEYSGGYAFEIIYTTESGLAEYWQQNKDDCVELWRAGKILFDRDGTAARLREFGRKIEEAGKPPLGPQELHLLRFNAADQLKAIEGLKTNNPVTARMLLTALVFHFTGFFFEINQYWSVPPKQRLAAIKELSPALAELIEAFYLETGLAEQIQFAHAMFARIFTTI
ncbi:MAG: nucleotidyltransferase domain-containing protein [Chloroflexi bacterium]|nr:nucleotidyltransferase domain-containing protein [Chloroflexota bacterium]OJV99841.1 MAG: hypothetical protein BGO39_29115 [Chloroflexi bacterium 54-19]